MNDDFNSLTNNLTIQKHNERFLLLYTKNLMCIAAMNTLDDILNCVKKLYFKANGHLKSYLYDNILSLEHDPKPPKSVYISRRDTLSSEYDTYLIKLFNELKTDIAPKQTHKNKKRLIIVRG